MDALMHEMKTTPEPIPRGEMLRTNTAVAVVLAAVLVLALVAVLAGFRASRNQARAQEAEAAGRERLWNAYVSQARAERISRVPGCREAALEVISNAATLRVSPTLRAEAIACLALSDLAQEGALFKTRRDLTPSDLDLNLKRYACGDAQGNVVVGDLDTGETLFTLQARELGSGTRRAVGRVLFSPDGALLAVRFAGALVVWELATQKILWFADTESGSTLAADLAFSPDSSRLIFRDVEAQEQITECEAATGRVLTRGIPGGLASFRLRPDGKQVALVTRGGVSLLDYPAGTNAQLLRHAAPVSYLAWSPLGDRLATSCDDGDIYIWDLARGTRRIFRGHSERAVSLGFSADGTKFFSSSRDGTTRLWDLAEGQTIAVGEGIAYRFTPDGKRLGFFRQLTGFGVWRVLQARDYRLLPCAKSEGPLFTLDLSPSGRWCVATQDKGFRLWDLSADEGEYYFALPQLYCARISADEQSLWLCRESGLEVWPLANCTANPPDLRSTNTHRFPLPNNLGARAIALSLDGRSAAVELTDQRFIALDLTGQKAPVFLKDCWRTVNFKGPASATGAGRFAISPEGRWIATGFGFGVDDVPRVWDAHTGELVARLEAETSLAGFSPDGRWLGLAGVDSYSLWSVGDWQPHGGFDRSEPSIVHGTLAFERDNGFWAAASTRQTVQMRSLFTDEVLFELAGPTPQSINSVRLAHDGSVLVTATASDLVEVWRLGHLQKELATMGLDWGASAYPGEAGRGGSTSGRKGPALTLVLSMAGCVLAGVFAVLTLRQHRASISRFLKAEAEAADRRSELEVARVELMHSQKMQALGTLSAGIAHDFNNLLSVIRMSNKLIGRSIVGNGELEEHVADIEQAAVQGKSVVRSMLGYARDETTRFKRTNVNEVVEMTVSLLSKEFLSGIRLTLELASEALPVTTHHGLLEQILLNLVINASEAMQGRGRLVISTHLRYSAQDGHSVLRPRAAPRYVALTVSDSGPGIAPEIIERIFDPFFTTKRSLSTPGTGLGLSQVYSIAQQGGLGLSVESVPGSGATFSVWIPAEARSTDASSAGPVREKHTTQPKDLPLT
jgi:signal transduction histidine kinase